MATRPRQSERRGGFRCAGDRGNAYCDASHRRWLPGHGTADERLGAVKALDAWEKRWRWLGVTNDSPTMGRRVNVARHVSALAPPPHLRLPR